MLGPCERLRMAAEIKLRRKVHPSLRPLELLSSVIRLPKYLRFSKPLKSLAMAVGDEEDHGQVVGMPMRAKAMRGVAR